MAEAASKVSPTLQALIDKGLLDRLPVTFAAYLFDQIREWDLLFPAEQSYYERLCGMLDRSRPEDVDRVFAPVRDAEKLMGVNEKTWPKREFSLEQVDFLNRSSHYGAWRAAIAKAFVEIDPLLDAEISSRGRARLVVVLSPGELPVDPDRMWGRVAKYGTRTPVTIPDDVTEFASLLLTGKPTSDRAPSLSSLYAKKRMTPYDQWIVEAGDQLCTRDAESAGVVRLSYRQLEPYRKRLQAEVNRVVKTENISGPRQLSARLKQLKVLPGESALANTPILAEFTRATLLSGNGTLLLNNTFVEWATVQAVRRARPSLVVAAFGIRNKVKPFSSMLIYADQDAVSPIPSQMDTLGTYVDLEMFYQYIWQEFEKYVEYRKNTVYVFAGEGMDQLLVVAPPDFPKPTKDSPISLPRLHDDLKTWMGLA